MAAVQPVSTISTTHSGPRHNSLGLRIWHWANSGLVLFQLMTILFLFVIVKVKTLAPEFSQVLAEKGVNLPAQELRGLTRIVAHRIWDWHIWAGITIACLLAFRVLVSFRQRGGQRTAAKLAAIKAREARGEAGATKARWVRYSYRAFYVILAIMVSTGLILVFEDYFPSIEHLMKEIHEYTMYAVIAFVVAHIVGVFRAEVTEEPGVVSAMINGGEPAEIS
ncbi:cytochrome b/b6 domain-containing protein [Hymenobacter psychrophilus]|uniref:Ni,Fe-hydrogenase I cytochrome b subunit n=1 Tax=Hymenobacter psychrophilus TaxID=651662 RepID=A0A1H3KIS1_9BACT|nr:cytochrome b/b6 domain-containing protein [Hymenobacter psychrophilus]SDY52023.1 Ni,Fe-hydrogenase I cytochrome b subunit [Hymenobacter psychrophilus]